MSYFAAFRPLGLGLLALAAAGCVQRVDAPPKSVVFFTNDSVAIGPNAKTAIDQFAQDAGTVPNRPVLVEAYAGTSSSPAANRQLSLARAQVVADELVARGVNRARITLQPRPPTGEDPGVEGRRVELEFGR